MVSNVVGGFSSGFQRSYESRRDRQRDLEDDVFRMNYGRFYKTLDERKERERQEAKYGSLADSLSNGDAGKRQLFYNMLQNGASTNEIMDFQKEYEVQSIAPDGLEGPQDVSQSVPMAPKGSTTGQPQDLTQPSPNKSLSRSDYANNGRSFLANPQEQKISAMQEKSVRRIAKMSGMKEAEVRNVLYGKATQDNSKYVDVRIVPKSRSHLDILSKVNINNGFDMAMAAEANGDYKLAESIRKRRSDLQKMREEDVEVRKNMEPLWVSVQLEDGTMDTRKAMGNEYGYILVDDEDKPKGSFLRFSQSSPEVVSFERKDETTRELSDGILKSIYNDVYTLNKSKASINTMATNALSAIKIFEDNPSAQSAGATVASWVRGAERDTQSFLDLYKQWSSERGDRYTSGQLKSWLDSGNARSLFGVDRIDLDKGRRQILLTNLTLTFDIMAAMGQTGNAVNAREFEAVFGALSEGDPAKYKANVRHYLDMAMTKYANEHEAFTDQARTFRAQTYLSDWDDMKENPHKVIIKGFDPEVRETFGFFDESVVGQQSDEKARMSGRTLPEDEMTVEQTNSPFQEGQIIRNKKTGQRARIVNGKPVPIDGE